MTPNQKLTKDQIAKQLVQFDILLSPTAIKKTPIAKLEAMLREAIDAEAAKQDVRRADIDAACASHLITKIPPKVERKPRKPATIDVDKGSPDALEPEKPARARARAVEKRAAANVEAAGGKVIPMKPRASKGINLAPKPAAQIKTCRAGTVQAALIDLLVDGATLWELQGAAPKWSESSVKSGLHYDVHFVKGYGVRTEVMTPRAAYEAGHEAHCENMLGTELEHEPVVAVYFLVLPEGMTEPLPHSPRSDRGPIAPGKMAAIRG